MTEQGGSGKITIIRGKPSGDSVSFAGGDELRLPFNPTEYSLDKKNNYAVSAVPGLESPIVQYGSGDARTLSFEVLLDTHTYGNQQDVRDAYLNKLDQFAAVDGDLHAPPPCKVMWGSLQFVGVIEDIRKRFLFFLGDGTPVRARVTLSLREYIPVAIQVRATPRSSPDRLKGHTIRDGDSLWKIASEAYGDPRLWKILAEANDLDDPLRLETGRLLLVPPLEPVREGHDAGLFD